MKRRRFLDRLCLARRWVLTAALAWFGTWLIAPQGRAQIVPSPVSVLENPDKKMGSIEGVVTFHGEVPKARVGDESGAYPDLLQVDAKTRGLEHVVAFLELEKPPVDPGSHPGKPPRPVSRKPVGVDQRDSRFVPRMLAVRAGESVAFTNSDAGNHNVRTTSREPKNEFNVFTGNGGAYQHRFYPETNHRPIRVGCDIHPWMRAWIYVFDHPFFAVTDGLGRFHIGSVPPGRYKLILGQPDAGYSAERAVVVAFGEPARVEVQIKADDLRDRKATAD